MDSSTFSDSTIKMISVEIMLIGSGQVEPTTAMDGLSVVCFYLEKVM